MRFYCQPHRFYCGIDLHARCMYLCILDQDGNTIFDRNLPWQHVSPTRKRGTAPPCLRVGLTATPSLPFAMASSSAWNACSAGTGLPTCAAARLFYFAVGRRSLCTEAARASS
jgi:hypothetical protein